MASAGSKEIIRLKLVLEREPGLRYSSILQKTKRYGRSSVKIQEKGTSLEIEITAKDIVALRASANSIIRDLQAISATKIK